MGRSRTTIIILALVLLASLDIAIPVAADYDINAPSGFEASGVVWHSRLDKLFAVDDGGRVVRMDRDGTNQTLWDVPGDNEGICVPDPATDRLFVGVEYDGGHLMPALEEFNITTGAVTRTFYLNLPGATASQGLEAVTFVPNATHPQGGEFYVGHQGNGDIYTYDIPVVTGGGSGSTYNYNHTIVTNRTDLAGLYYNASGKVLDALFDSFNKIQVIRLNGSVIHEFDLAAKAGFSEDEGIGEDNMGHLYIARENNADGMISVLKNFLDITGPRVVSVELSDPSPTRAGDVTFTIGFNEPVNTKVAPKVLFGRSFPFTVHPLGSIGWVNSTHWRGDYVMDGSTGDGWNNLSISGAVDVIGNLMEPDWNHSFLLDTKAPKVRSVKLAPHSPIGKGHVGFTVEFDEPMDNSSAPTVTFANAAPYKSHAVSPIGWANGTVWKGYTDIDTPTGDGLNHLRIAKVADLANNTMLDDWNSTFIVDTTPPVVVSVGLSDPSPVGAGTVTFTIRFDEAMDTAIPPAVTFGRSLPYGDHALLAVGWSNGTVWSGKFAVNSSTGDGLQHLMVREALDAPGNKMSPDSDFSFEIDAKRPSVVSVRLDPASPLAEGPVNFTIGFSEPMDTSLAPVAAFGLDLPHTNHTITAVGWSNSTHWIGNYVIDKATGDGINRITISGARDPAGNPMVGHNGSVFTIDTHPPTSVVDALAPYHNVRRFNVGYTANDPNTGVEKVELWARSDGTGQYVLSDPAFTASHDGRYEFYTIATDMAGNREPAPDAPDAGTIVDTVRPTVTRVDLGRPGPYDSNVKVTVHFSEPVNSSGLRVSFGSASPFNEFTVQGGPIGPDAWAGDIVVNAAVPNGTYALYITDARDMASNELVPDTSTAFTVRRTLADRTPPTVTGLSIDTEQPVGAGDVNLTIVFSEDMDHSGPLLVDLRSGSGPDHFITGTWSGDRTWKGTVTITDGWGNGTFTFMIKDGRDLAGNTMLEDANHTMVVAIKGPPGPHHNDSGLAQWSIALIIVVLAGIVASVGLYLILSKRRKKDFTDDDIQGPEKVLDKRGPKK